MTFTATRDDLADELIAAGLPSVTTDPATANPPCVVVAPWTNISPAGPCAWDADLDVWLIHPAPAGAAAVAWLESQLPAALGVVSPSATDPAEFTTYPHQSGPLPAYRITCRTTIPAD